VGDRIIRNVLPQRLYYLYEQCSLTVCSDSPAIVSLPRPVMTVFTPPLSPSTFVHSPLLSNFLFLDTYGLNGTLDSVTPSGLLDVSPLLTPPTWYQHFIYRTLQLCFRIFLFDRLPVILSHLACPANFPTSGIVFFYPLC